MLDRSEPPKTRILVVEDSYLTAQAVCDLVIKHGYDVAGSVGRVESGVKFISENDVDAAVVDIDLHGMASFPICEQLRKRDIPFVFLTGYDRPYPVPAEFRTTLWLHKPINDREFRIALAGLAKAVAAPGTRRDNVVLDRLSADDWHALQAHVEHLPVAAGDVLATAADKIPYVYFPTSGVISVNAYAQGKSIEVALVGREGAIGLEVALGKARSASTESVVHAAGSAWRVPAKDLARLIEERPTVRAELLGVVHAYLREIAENAVAIGNGTIEQRLARRLLMVSLRLGTQHLALTHDALARLMAVRRSGITVALHMLESKRAIRARRSAVEILDYESLARAAGGMAADDVFSCTAPGASPSR